MPKREQHAKIQHSKIKPGTKAETLSGGELQPPKGKLGVMLPGMGAVATTFVAGVEAIRKGLAQPIGSLTQMGTIRLGKRTESRAPQVKEFVSLAGLNDLVFTGWDIFEDNMYAAAAKAGVLDAQLLDRVKKEIQLQTKALDDALGPVFEAVSNDQTYRPDTFVQALKQFQAKLP
jgi:myo-inositol-1-phosphate synthase